jgi:FMN reductase
MPPTAVAISGSPSPTSRSRQLLAHVLVRLAAGGATTRTIDLADLPAEPLLGRAPSHEVAGAIALVQAARIVVVGTPVYRASYSGLLKLFFDLLEPDTLSGKAVILLASGGGPAHQLVLEHALRPLVASVGALAVPTAVYATERDFSGAAPADCIVDRIDRAVAEALAFSTVPRAAFAGAR